MMDLLRFFALAMSYLLVSGCNAAPDYQGKIEQKLISMFNEFAFDPGLPQLIYRPERKFRGYILSIDQCYNEDGKNIEFIKSKLLDIIEFPIAFSFQYEGFRKFKSYGAYGCPVPNEPNIKFKTYLAKNLKEYDRLISRLPPSTGAIVRTKQKNNQDYCHIHIETKGQLITGSTTIVLWPYGMNVPDQAYSEVVCMTSGVLASMGMMGALSVPGDWLVYPDLEMKIKEGFGVFGEPIGIQHFYEAKLEPGMTKAEAENIVRKMPMFSRYVKKFIEAEKSKNQ
jgi:hypothetical protein